MSFVFIGLLQDAGLALVDITGILDAADASEWKSIRLVHTSPVRCTAPMTTRQRTARSKCQSQQPVPATISSCLPCGGTTSGIS
jgi:hypothetical protein